MLLTRLSPVAADRDSTSRLAIQGAEGPLQSDQGLEDFPGAQTGKHPAPALFLGRDSSSRGAAALAALSSTAPSHARMTILRVALLKRSGLGEGRVWTGTS